MLSSRMIDANLGWCRLKIELFAVDRRHGHVKLSYNHCAKEVELQEVCISLAKSIFFRKAMRKSTHIYVQLGTHFQPNIW